MKRLIRKSLAVLLVFTLFCCTNYTRADTLSFNDLDDPRLKQYLEATVYTELINKLNSDGYFVENVTCTFVSEEYLEALEYNSRENIYFGYKLSEIEEQFQGKKYIFTLGDNGETIVKEFEEYDDSFEKIVKNVLIGSGVILLCVTVSAVSGGLGAPAVSMIFAMSAKTGSIMALSGSAIGGLSAGIIAGIQTGDMNYALESAAIGASEGFKWGAISGTLLGGGKELAALHGASSLDGLTMNEAAFIQHDSGYPLDVIKGFKSMEQYEICKDAGLTPKMVNGKLALIRKIDLNYIDEEGMTNLSRMQKGLAAIDPTTGQSYELHHIGQRMDSTLSILTMAEHKQGGNDLIWHKLGSDSMIDRDIFKGIREDFWKEVAVIMVSAPL